MHEDNILYGTYCVSGVRATILLYGHAMYIATEQAPSKDIATAFAIQESIRFTFSGSCYNTSERSDIP